MQPANQKGGGGQLGRPLGANVQQMPGYGPANAGILVDGGQMGFGSAQGGVQIGMHQIGTELHQQGRPLDLRPQPWRASQSGSQVQPGLSAHQPPWHASQPGIQATPAYPGQQQQAMLQQPWRAVQNSSTAGSGLPTQQQQPLQKQSNQQQQQKQQRPSSVQQQQQQRFPPPPGSTPGPAPPPGPPRQAQNPAAASATAANAFSGEGSLGLPQPPTSTPPSSSNSSGAASAKTLRSRWDRAADMDKQQQAGHQLMLHSGQQLPPPPQLNLQQQQQHPALQGRGHEHIPVLQLSQVSQHGVPSGGVLVLDRLDAPQRTGTPPLHMQQTQQMLAGKAAPGHPSTVVLGGAGVPLPAPSRDQLPGQQGPPSTSAAAAAPSAPPAPGMQQQQQQQLRPSLPGPPAVATSVGRPPPGGAVVITAGRSAPLQQQQQANASFVVLGPQQAATGVAGAPVGVMTQSAMQQLQKEASNLQGILQVLETLTKQQQANRLPNLTAHEAVQAVQLLATAAQVSEQVQLLQQRAEGKLEQLHQHAGVQFLCQRLHGAVAQVDAQQQLQLLDCLAAVAQSGLGPIPTSLVDAIVSSLAHSGALESPDTLLCTASVLAHLADPINDNSNSSSGSSSPVRRQVAGLSVLLAEPLLKKLLREDADVGCGLVLEMLIGLHDARVAVPQKVQDGVSKVLQDHLSRFTPPQLAALLACHSQLGFEQYAKLLRKTAAEYLKRPVQAAGADLLLGVLSGLAAGGYASVRELPAQLLAKLCDELQPLLPTCAADQLLTAGKVLAQLGCLKANSPKQQQLVNVLQQQLTARRLEPQIWLALPELISGLRELIGQQHQAGLVSLIKELTAVQDSQVTAVQQAVQQQPIAVVKLVAGLQLQGKLEGQARDQLKDQVVLAVAQLCSAAAEQQQQQHAIGDLRQTLAELRPAELAAVVSAIVDMHPATVSSSSSAAADNDSDPAVTPGSAVASLLKAVLQTDALMQQQTPAAAAEMHHNKQLQEPEQRASTPPLPPAAAAGAAPPPPPPAVPSESAAAAAGPPPPPPPTAVAATTAAALEVGGTSSRNTGGVAAATGAAVGAVVPLLYSEEDWAALAQLLDVCVHWYPLEELPPDLVQLVLEVIECQAALGCVSTCSAEAAVSLLWGLAVAGSLMLELWDALAVALDKPDVGLQQEQLKKVFEAYCLVVLRISGPLPHPVPAGQLALAGEAYWNAIVVPVAAGRQQLQDALTAAGLLPAGRRITSQEDGHLTLFDMVMPESKQAWVLSGSRSPVVSAAAELLLSRSGWVLVHISETQLNASSNANPNAASCAPQLQQVSQVAQLLPRLIALLQAHSNPQQQGQQASILPDAASAAGLAKLVAHLRTSIRQGTLLAALPPAQMNTLRHIADMYKGDIVQKAPELPRFGSVRLQRLQQQLMSAVAADSDYDMHNDSEADEEGTTVEYDENDMDAQEMFIHNRLWLLVDDPWWFCQRLLVQPVGEGAAPGGGLGFSAAAGAQNSNAALASGSAAAFQLSVESLKIAKAAAAAALVVRAQWEKQEAEAAAAAAAARAAAGLPPLEQAATPATGEGDATAEQERGRSIEQQAKRKRYWRESRSRSRSRSVDSGISSSTNDGSSSSGGDSSEHHGGSSSTSSEDEEGAISTDSEEGEIDVSPRSKVAAATTAAAAQQREPLRRGKDQGTSVAPMPVSFSARGVFASEKPSWKQQQLQQGRTQLRRGRTSRSSSRSRSRSSSRDRDRNWRHGANADSSRRARSRSPAVLRRGRSRSRSASPLHLGRGWAVDKQHSPQHRAKGDAAQTQVAEEGQYDWAALQQQQQLQQLLLHQQQLQAAAATAAAAAQQQQQQKAVLLHQQLQHQQQQAAYVATASWMSRFSHMPKAQAKLAGLLQTNLIDAGDIRESALYAALQLPESTLLQALEELHNVLTEREVKKAAAVAVALMGGAATNKYQHKHQGEINGKLVNICRRLGASAPTKKEKEAAAAAAAMASGFSMSGMAGGFGGWNGMGGSPAVAAVGGTPGGPAAATAKGAGGFGYMYVNGMLVPVAAAPAGFALGASAGAYGAAATAAAGGGGAAKGKGKGGSGGKKAAVAAAAGPGAGGDVPVAASGGSSGAAGGPSKGANMMSQYWQALCSGLGADGDTFSDVEDEGDGSKKQGKKKQKQ